MASGNFEKLLEHVIECETEKKCFFLGRLTQCTMAIHNSNPTLNGRKVSILRAKRTSGVAISIIESESLKWRVHLTTLL
jgi:hypothetical protein